ncbi:MAG: glycosyltransferase [archaeon]
MFDTVQITRPNTNKAEALMKLKKHANSKYLLYFEDDHVYFRDINLDRLLEVMDKYPIINQLSFNKHTLVGESRKLPKPSKKFGYKHFIYESRQFDEFETVVAER